MNSDGNHKAHQKIYNSRNIGTYNLTGRANAYLTFFTWRGGNISEYRLSTFARSIPFINYNISF